MAVIKNACRSCGKEYEACHTLGQSKGVFNWKEVACSPECGTKYFQKVEASRKGNTPPVMPQVKMEADLPELVSKSGKDSKEVKELKGLREVKEIKEDKVAE